MSNSGKVFALIVVAGGLVALSHAGKNAPALQPEVQIERDAAPRPCTVADFSVSKTRASTESDEATLTGIITSRCASSAGVQLKWTAFYADGTVAFSNDSWPASTTNIPPNSVYPFEMMNSAPRGKWTYRVEPIKVNVW
jgi:hypothetical protein